MGLLAVCGGVSSRGRFFPVASQLSKPVGNCLGGAATRVLKGAFDSVIK